jgi:hypothetical protein
MSIIITNVPPDDAELSDEESLMWSIFISELMEEADAGQGFDLENEIGRETRRIQRIFKFED